MSFHRYNKCLCINALPEPTLDIFQTAEPCIYLQKQNKKSIPLVILVWQQVHSRFDGG